MNSITEFKAGENFIYSTFNSSDVSEKMTVANALLNPTHELKDFINKEIEFVNCIIDVTELEKKDAESNIIYDENGAVVTVQMPRITLFDKKGESYVCVSQGVYNSLSRIISLFGSWSDIPKGTKFAVRQRTTSKGRNVLLIEFA